MKTKQSDAVLMIEFALRRLRWGGGTDGDIVLAFGLPASTFYEQVAVIVERRQLPLDHRKAVQLKRLCAEILTSPPISAASPSRLTDVGVSVRPELDSGSAHPWTEWTKP